MILATRIFLGLMALLTVGPSLYYVFDPVNAFAQHAGVLTSPVATTEIRVAFGGMGVAGGLYLGWGAVFRDAIVESLRFLVILLGCVWPIRVFGTLHDSGTLSNYWVPVIGDGTFLLLGIILLWTIARREPLRTINANSPV
jgi:Domain of unknown function (DUF4345)